MGAEVYYACPNCHRIQYGNRETCVLCRTYPARLRMIARRLEQADNPCPCPVDHQWYDVSPLYRKAARIERELEGSYGTTTQVPADSAPN